MSTEIQMNLIRTCLLLGGLLGAFGAAAHHAATGLYDRNTIGEIEGEISSIFWRNPHIRFGITRVGGVTGTELPGGF